MTPIKQTLLIFFLALLKIPSLIAQTNSNPDQIKVMRQGVRRIIVDESQKIPLPRLNPAVITGMSAMNPTTFYSGSHGHFLQDNIQLLNLSNQEFQSSIWFAGSNPYAVYIIDMASCSGQCEFGFEILDPEKSEQFFKCWRGLTTGLSTYANSNEKKQLLAVGSKNDPRFGFSVMQATPFGMVGDFDDPHVLFDSGAKKWWMLVCENVNKGCKAIMLESFDWNKNYHRIACPIINNSARTSIQRIGDKQYCLSGSQDRKIYIYTNPELAESGTLKMDLPPCDETSGIGEWLNVVQLPEEYPFRYVALMKDHFNYPEPKNPN